MLLVRVGFVGGRGNHVTRTFGLKNVDLDEAYAFIESNIMPALAHSVSDISFTITEVAEESSENLFDWERLNFKDPIGLLSYLMFREIWATTERNDLNNTLEKRDKKYFWEGIER